MRELIDVKCPHCGAVTHAMLPPNGLILIGPCPECREFVALFCGVPLPVHKDIILYGSLEERHEHILSVLTSFLDERIGALLEQIDQEGSLPADDPKPRGAAPAPTAHKPESLSAPRPPQGRITRAEIKRFVEEELPRLDDSGYFGAIFP